VRENLSIFFFIKMSRNSYYEDDLYNRNKSSVSNRNSTGGIMKPKTEWTINNERGPTLNSKHYKLLSKKTLDSLQALKPVNPSERLSTGSITPTTRHVPSNVMKAPKIVDCCPGTNLEIIIEEDESISCSKNTDSTFQIKMKVLKPVLSNLSSASTDTIDITGNNTEHTSFHEINTASKKKRDSVSDHQSNLNDKNLSEVALHSRHSCSIQKLLNMKPSDCSVSGGGLVEEEEFASLLMPLGSGRPRNDSDCTIDYNCCSDDSSGKDTTIVVAVESDLKVAVLKTDHTAQPPLPQPRSSKKDPPSVAPEESCSRSQQDLISPQSAPQFVPALRKTVSVGGAEWSSLEDSPMRPGETIPHKKDKTKGADKTVGAKCSCTIC
jgi:hypothetical protein